MFNSHRIIKSLEKHKKILESKTFTVIPLHLVTKFQLAENIQ